MSILRQTYLIIKKIYYWLIKKKYGFGECKSYFNDPLYLHNADHIFIGANCHIMPLARLEAIRCYYGNEYNGELIIEDHVSIGQGSHIVASNKLVIEKDATLSSYVFISDCHHNYEDIETPVLKQSLLVKSVHIGEGCLIGRGVAVLAGGSVGKHSVIGANSVVTSNIPDYCVAAGIPAKVIKKYDFERKSWVKIY